MTEVREKYRITKIGTAVEQLEWAIVLLLDFGACIPSIALAAAAKEVLGKAPGVQPSFVDLRDSLVERSGLEPKAVADEHLNRSRNWFKHWGPTDEDHLVLEPETEAI